MSLTVAAELEAQLTCEDGTPADTLHVLGGKSITFPNRPFATVTPDAARCSVECATGICTSEAEVLHDLKFLRASIPPPYKVVYRTRIPVPAGLEHVPLANKQRYDALIKGLRREAPTGWHNVYNVAACCSTQVHVGVDPLTVPGTSLLNFMNHIAPYAALRVREMYGVRDADGHSLIWSEFADARRFPAPRWFTSPDHLVAFVSKIPQVVKYEQGEWVTDLVTPTTIGDAGSEGTIWWHARPRGQYKTIEFRPFPSLRPRHAAQLAGMVKALAEAFLHESQGEGFANAMEARPIFTALHGKFPLVPARPFTDREWHHNNRL